MPDETHASDQPVASFDDLDSDATGLPDEAEAMPHDTKDHADAIGAALATTVAAAAGADSGTGESAVAGAAADDDGAVAASAAVAAQGGGAQAAGAAFQLSEDVGLAVTTFKRSRARPANPELLELFVKDDHLVALWNEIGRVELEVIELRRASKRVTRELLDRLAMARNLLLANRDLYEDVLLQVNIVKSKLQQVRHSNRAQQPWTIQVFLYAVVAILAVLFIQGPRIALMLGNQPEVVGIPTQVLWNTVLWGGIGGLSAALYALVKHMEDYEHEHARWYYLSPVIGLFFGPLVALLADVGLPAFVQLVGDASGEMQVRPAVMYLLAWAVGFKQNLLIQLINSVLARIVPGLRPADRPAS